MRTIGGTKVENCVRFIRVDGICLMKAHITSWSEQGHYVAVHLAGAEGCTYLMTEETKKLCKFIEECMLLGGY